jgi:hypothetical protein
MPVLASDGNKPNGLRIGKGSDLSPNVDMRTECLNNHKCVRGALNRVFYQMYISGSGFFSAVICL